MKIKNIIKCPECEGEGVISWTEWKGDIMDDFHEDCWFCDGYGYISIGRWLWWKFIYRKKYEN